MGGEVQRKAGLGFWCDDEVRFHIIFITALLICHSRIIQFIHLKCKFSDF